MGIGTLFRYYPEMTCDSKTLIDSKVNKLIVIDFVKDSGKDKVKGRIENALKSVQPEKEDMPEGLQEEIDGTIDYFKKDVKKGHVSQLAFSPDYDLNMSLTEKKKDLKSSAALLNCFGNLFRRTATWQR